MFLYFAIADLGPNKNRADKCCKLTKLRGVVGASRKPFAEALCRSMMV
jgi:hypothetical protein